MVCVCVAIVFLVSILKGGVGAGAGRKQTRKQASETEINAKISSRVLFACVLFF